MTLNDKLDALALLEAAATPGRWYDLIDDYGDTGRVGSMFLTHEAVLNGSQDALAAGLAIEDAALIVALRNIAPELLAVVRVLPDLVYDYGVLIGSDGEDVLADSSLGRALRALAELEAKL